MNLGCPQIEILSRIDFADTLRKDAALSYKTEVGRHMTPKHQRLVSDSVIWAVCELRKDSRRMNDVFRRAGIIALWWAKGAPDWSSFGLNSLIDRVREFLHREGADPAPKSDATKARRDIESALAICKQPGWTHTCSDTKLLSQIQHVIAEHWVCSESNHKGCFLDKGCHA